MTAPWWTNDTVTIWHANARELPLPDESVDLVVTSPPYFGLRSYQDGGEHYAGQIGDEPTPVEFVDALIDCTREMVRVLKPSGSIWVNLGDKYARPGGGIDVHARTLRSAGRGTIARRATPGPAGAPEKSLVGIPWRYALRCVDDLRLILRAEVIWSKPNGLPESVTDRVRRSHETWFHFTRSPRYYSAVDEIREQYAPETSARYAYGFRPAAAVAAGQSANGPTRADGGGPTGTNPLGKLPGSVWEIPTQPLKVPEHLGIDHFAAFPMQWPRRIIRGWSPARGTVLDPFSGTGTTGLVAAALGRRAHLVDLSEDYCRLARWRVTDPAERARALQVDKPPPEPDGIPSLLDLIDT